MSEQITLNRAKNNKSNRRKMVGLIGLEPMTPALSRRCSNQLSYRPLWRDRGPQSQISDLKSQIAPAARGGGYRIRTDDILLAKQTLYQLS